MMEWSQDGYLIHTFRAEIFNPANPLEFKIGAGFLILFGILWLLGKRPPWKQKLEKTLQVTGFMALFLSFSMGAHLLGFELPLRFYAFAYLLGAIVAIAFMTSQSKKGYLKMTPNMIFDYISVYLFFGVILGARSFYVFLYSWPHFSKHPLEILQVWHGGLSYHGGVTGVIVATLLFAKKYRLRFFHVIDPLARIAPFGIGIGRMANFLNNGGELFGRETNVPWGVIFRHAGGGEIPRHPSQLYQSFCEGWLLLLTLFIISKFKPKEGTISAGFLFFYGLYRFPIENFRQPDPQLNFVIAQLTMGQLLSIAAMLGGVLVFAITRRNPQTHTEKWLKDIEEFLQKEKQKEEMVKE